MSQEQFLTPIERIAIAAEVLKENGGLPNGGSSQEDSGGSSIPSSSPAPNYDLFFGLSSTGDPYQKYPLIIHPVYSTVYYGLVMNGSSFRLETCSNIDVVSVSDTQIDITFHDTNTSQNFTQSYYTTYDEALDSVTTN